ncbi:hypothetical protein BS17DRAFT_450069 [Gyrodon lividus]|nr:hypothetical protein BS17DRAFT_450069 [Gyrodon lividus]
MFRTSQLTHLLVRGPALTLRSRSSCTSPRLWSTIHHQPAWKAVSSRKLSTSPAMMHDSSSGANREGDNTGTGGPGTFDDVIARSKKSSEVQNNIAVDLPEIPSIPNKRTLHINHEDLETRIRPLLSCHWHVGHVGRGVHDLEVLSINKLFSFKNFRSAVDFFNALADIQDEEDHHARVNADYSNVYICIHTHVALQHISSTTGESRPIKVPGLTNRDIRFAVKVEKLHQKFLEDQRAITKVPAGSACLQEWSMEHLRQRYPASRAQDMDMRRIEAS